jgi:hypothetical protein
MKYHKKGFETVLIDRFSSKTALLRNWRKMARAKRHYIPGYVWHITHRCHKREFLLKFPRDRRRWIEWLYQAKKRYSGLSVLDYEASLNPSLRKFFFIIKHYIPFLRSVFFIPFGNSTASNRCSICFGSGSLPFNSAGSRRTMR